MSETDIAKLDIANEKRDILLGKKLDKGATPHENGSNMHLLNHNSETMNV